MQRQFALVLCMLAVGLTAQAQSLPQLAVLESSLASGIDPAVDAFSFGGNVGLNF
jgi:hypothetical protein